ncbi:hypothetical protein AQUCO_01300928v1 [Aquilegia coerulea]|uniref:RBR-type E3 ubiquitin transferase n=1 Tax=Aquilegia coerulea TaxID=218851 RepID=A0A2G5E462_AQUCA|nr:hypothetical protein AQUCO_01300928v1 [Aquilegia coerulea]
MGNAIQKPKQSIKEFKKKCSIFTCDICYESRNKKFKHNKWKSHPICIECITRYIHTKVDENCLNIKCPHPKCKKILDPNLYRSIIPLSLFQKWFDLTCRDTIMRFDRAYCPFSDCSVLILNECKDKVGKTKCPKCKRQFCFKCQVPWNVCGKCGEAGEMQDENDNLFRDLAIAQKWIRCPACYHVVERISGCPEVRCRCGIYFCYTCGRRLSDHYNGRCPRSRWL